ncbi:MAG: hypothetical protein AB1726_10240 [Planctomycetota bacterium]
MASVRTLYDLVPGAIVADRFRIVAPHRQGGLSAAFAVLDGKTGETCELQYFPAGLFEIHAQVEEFRTILLPWKRVRAGGVLAVREVLSIGPGSLVLVTDLPRGESLRARLKRDGKLDPVPAIRLGCRILEALEAIHSHELVHGDIKPFTIHLPEVDSDGLPQPLLVDGGLTPGLWTAKGLGDRTALIGTPYYAPIEQFGGESPDVRSDVYNVATVLFECVTGVLPWPGRSFLEVFQAKLARRPPTMRQRAPAVQVDPAIERVIVRGCLADREERPATAAEFRAALAALL